MKTLYLEDVHRYKALNFLEVYRVPILPLFYYVPLFELHLFPLWRYFHAVVESRYLFCCSRHRVWCLGTTEEQLRVASQISFVFNSWLVPRVSHSIWIARDRLFYHLLVGGDPYDGRVVLYLPRSLYVAPVGDNQRRKDPPPTHALYTSFDGALLGAGPF